MRGEVALLRKMKGKLLAFTLEEIYSCRHERTAVPLTHEDSFSLGRQMSAVTVDMSGELVLHNIRGELLLKT